MSLKDSIKNFLKKYVMPSAIFDGIVSFTPGYFTRKAVEKVVNNNTIVSIPGITLNSGDAYSPLRTYLPPADRVDIINRVYSKFGGLEKSLIKDGLSAGGSLALLTFPFFFLINLYRNRDKDLRDAIKNALGDTIKCSTVSGAVGYALPYINHALAMNVAASKTIEVPFTKNLDTLAEAIYGELSKAYSQAYTSGVLGRIIGSLKTTLGYLSHTVSIPKAYTLPNWIPVVGGKAIPIIFGGATFPLYCIIPATIIMEILGYTTWYVIKNWGSIKEKIANYWSNLMNSNKRIVRWPAKFVHGMYSLSKGIIFKGIKGIYKRIKYWYCTRERTPYAGLYRRRIRRRS